MPLNSFMRSAGYLWGIYALSFRAPVSVYKLSSSKWHLRPPSSFSLPGRWGRSSYEVGAVAQADAAIVAYRCPRNSIVWRRSVICRSIASADRPWIPRSFFRKERRTIPHAVRPGLVLSSQLRPLAALFRHDAGLGYAALPERAVNGYYLRWLGQEPGQCNHNRRPYCAIRPRTQARLSRRRCRSSFASV